MPRLITAVRHYWPPVNPARINEPNYLPGLPTLRNEILDPNRRLPKSYLGFHVGMVKILLKIVQVGGIEYL